MIREGYRVVRDESHGVRASRRAALVVAIVLAGSPHWLLLRAPDWVKISPSERTARSDAGALAR